ncbi:MAG: twin-arginine translocase TatA/TatE family subunit [Candidatus Poribacteria bacterium]|nr:twin-arginine translocase TatA/TatE family subunit [Candidatus Poribacteria bacterium]
MPGSLGGWEILLILLAILVIFGPKRLPEMGRSLGKAIREFKSAGKDIQNDLAKSMDEEDANSSKRTDKGV